MEQKRDFVDWLLPYSDIITVVSTTVIAASAVVTAFLTWRLICDNRALAKVGTEPEVVAYLLSDPLRPRTHLALANVGRGPAKNVEFELDLEERAYDRLVFRNEKDRKPHGFLLQEEKIEMLLGDHRLFGKGEEREKNALRPFEVTVRWQNLVGREFNVTYTMDVRQFLGIPPVSSLYDPLSKIADSVAKIESSLRRRIPPA